MREKDRVAVTPPMGWNSFDSCGDYTVEADILENARLMRERLLPHGYEYVVVDIAWSRPLEGDHFPQTAFPPLILDEYGRQLPAPDRFPSAAEGRGFGPLARAVHDLGLKFGIHIMRGIPRQAVHARMPVLGTTLTADQVCKQNSVCKWFPDMYGVAATPGGQAYYDSLFALYAQWGVDFVKVDDICNTNAYPTDPYSAADEIEMIRRAMDRAGRSMVLSLSPGPAIPEKAWHLKEHANMWRITDDFWDRWELLRAMFERCEVWQDHVEPGCWPDCDMLPVGTVGTDRGHWKDWNPAHVTRFTPEEQRTMMNLWCIFRSPLMVGAKLSENDAFTRELLTNDEVLHLTRASHGARQLRRSGEEAVWTSREDETGDYYLALFNLSDAPRRVTQPLAALGLSGTVTLRELWQHQSCPGVSGEVSAFLAPHASALYRLTRE